MIIYDGGTNITMINYNYLRKLGKFVSIWRLYIFRNISGMDRIKSIRYVFKNENTRY